MIRYIEIVLKIGSAPQTDDSRDVLVSEEETDFSQLPSLNGTLTTLTVEHDSIDFYTEQIYLPEVINVQNLEKIELI